MKSFLAVVCAITTFPVVAAAELPAKPNIVFIMADDLGWSDVGFNGAKFYETPNLDQLRADGMLFTQAYAGGANCCPTRSCIISGMYTPRTKIYQPGGTAKGNISYMKFLVPAQGAKQVESKLNIKQNMAPSVTSLAEVLKPAGYHTARLGKWHLGPDTQGFDVSDPNGKGANPTQSFYGDIDVAESLTDRAVQYIKEHKGRPFFLYLCHWDVHSPHRTREAVKAKYDRKLAAGEWGREWDTTYAGMIEAVDTSVGRVRAALEKHNLFENTLFVFTSDNGGVSSITTNKPLKGGKGAFFEGGIREPTCMTWPKVIPPGSTCDTPITGVDFLPTFAELAGAELPQNQPVDGRSFVPLLRGESALTDRAIFWHYPLYLSASGEEDLVAPVFGTRLMYWRATPCSVIRQGDWKLIHFLEDDSVQLYNIREDIGESRDLSQSQPEKVRELREALSAWRTAVDADIPTVLNPEFQAPKGNKLPGKKRQRPNQPADESE